MPLDPQVKDYLGKMESLRLPGFHTMPVGEARSLFGAIRAMGGTPEKVAAVRDLATPGGIRLRSYTPLGDGPPAGGWPALVFYHGGGWVLGTLDTIDGLDPSRVPAGGDSAGGNLAAAVTILARDRGGPAIAFQLLIYPITDHSFDRPSYLDNAEGFGLSREMMAWYWDQYLARPEDGRDPLASVLRADDLAGLPPALVITAEYDVLRDEGEAYATRLREAGVAVEARRYDGQIHGFIQMGDTYLGARTAIQDVGEALRRALG